MKSDDDLGAVIGCQQAVYRFYAELDAGELDSVAASMAVHGVWLRQGQKLVGPQAVRLALADRPAGRMTAHLVQNLVIDLTDATTARARYMTLVYRFDAAEQVLEVAPLGLPLSISVNEDRLERDAAGAWVFTDKRSLRRFAS
jgi:hypothetical protein